MTLRVTATPSAFALIKKIQDKHGPIIFHQSGGCCDGSAPMCYPKGDFKIGAHDVHLGTVESCDVYISGPQFEKWKHTQLILDVVEGRGAGFSLEAPEGVRFLTRSRMFTEDELTELENAGPVHRGAAVEAQV